MNLLPYYHKLNDKEKKLIAHVLCDYSRSGSNYCVGDFSIITKLPLLDHDEVISRLTYYYNLGKGMTGLDIRVRKVLAKLDCEVKLK